jgi:hypothetical protein
MPSVDVPVGRVRFGHTARRDLWWLSPLLTVVGLGFGFGYLFWAMFQPLYWSGPYLSPVGSPPFFGDSPYSWFGAPPSWYPHFLPWQMLILWGPLALRLTCYYYRGTYYKAFWGDPPNCAVGEPRHSYRGENSFPLIIQNIHRYTFYLSLVFIFFLVFDVIESMRWPGPGAGPREFGLGFGTLLMATNITLIICYTFGCHSFRHLVGGVMDVMSRTPARRKAWDCVTCLNKRHGTLAWLSLYSMVCTDLYIRLCAHGVLHDLRFI